MQDNTRWLLPEGIDELLPPQAAKVEALRRQLLDLYNLWGYQLVYPPLVEHLNSLLTGAGSDLELQTFKLTDSLSGKLLGIRADTTPQVARIDAHKLGGTGVNRLCYHGTVLRTNPQGLSNGRAPAQIGIELFGHGGIESDAEILELMLETLAQSGLKNACLELGHVGIFRALVEHAQLDQSQEQQLMEILQRKAVTELKDLLQSWQLTEKTQQMLASLVDLYGDQSVIDKARKCLAAAPESLHVALDQLEAIVALLRRRHPNAQVIFDLGELRGYHYHTGVVFSAYLPGAGQAVAQGGRYDDIGKAFGCESRPATGFSTCLKTLMTLGQTEMPQQQTILAPVEGENAALEAAVKQFRQAGHVVIRLLPDQDMQQAEAGCSHQLVGADDGWQVKPLN